MSNVNVITHFKFQMKSLNKDYFTNILPVITQSRSFKLFLFKKSNFHTLSSNFPLNKPKCQCQYRSYRRFQFEISFSSHSFDSLFWCHNKYHSLSFLHLEMENKVCSQTFSSQVKTNMEFAAKVRLQLSRPTATAFTKLMLDIKRLL